MCGLATTGPQAAQLDSYGTHGLGTFAKMDGELLFIDGEAYQFTSDGRARRALPSTPLPFVQVTRFVPDYTTVVSEKLTKDDLMEVFKSGGPEAGGDNSFIVFCIKGEFKKMHLRIAGPQEYEGQKLSEVAANARQWTMNSIKGVMFGIYSPPWSQGMSVGGTHCHFLSEKDEEGVLKGGHVRDFEVENGVEISWAVTGRYHLGMPKGEAWNKLDLGTIDATGIKQAEGL